MSLEIKGIVAGYQNIEVLHDVSLIAKPGIITCLIGPNGAGKSTLLKVICGLLKPKKGKVLYNAEDITSLRPDIIVRKGLFYLIQGRSTFPYMSVWENLEMGSYIRKDTEQIIKDVKDVLELFPSLKDKMEQMAGTMSGGEQRMLEFARALIIKPKVILLDEPSIGLAPKLVEEVYEKILMMREMGLTLLVVEQNVRKVLSVSDYGYVLNLGKNEIQGNCEELLKNSELVKLYLGE